MPRRLVSHTHDVLSELEATISAMKDAEAGARGYIITDEARYLETYQAAVEQVNNHVARLKQLTADNSSQQARIPALKEEVENQLDNLKREIDLSKSGNAEGAEQLIQSSEEKRHRVNL